MSGLVVVSRAMARTRPGRACHGQPNVRNGVKLRKTRGEQSFSVLPPTTHIRRRPWLLRGPEVRRGLFVVRRVDAVKRSQRRRVFRVLARTTSPAGPAPHERFGAAERPAA